MTLHLSRMTAETRCSSRGQLGAGQLDRGLAPGPFGFLLRGRLSGFAPVLPFNSKALDHPCQDVVKPFPSHISIRRLSSPLLFDTDNNSERRFSHVQIFVASGAKSV